MTSIGDIVLSRVNLALSRHDPVQWSDNLQLALNLYTELTILEPRLPAYHQVITKTKQNRNAILHAKELFLAGVPLHTESIGELPLGRFLKVIFKNADEFFTGLPNDPTIVLHKWTPIFPRTRDCWLGVLFNTGELLVLGREYYKDSFSYRVKINMFEILVELYKIPFVDDKWYVSAKEFGHLKIKYFVFNMVEDVLHLAIVDIANRVSIFKWAQRNINKEGKENGCAFEFTLQLVKQYDFGKSILRIVWKENVFLIIGLDNSVTRCTSDFELKSILFPATRAQNQHNDILTVEGRQIIVSTFTSKVAVFDCDSNQKYEYDTGSWCATSSLNIGVCDNNVLKILISFEDGTLSTILFDLAKAKAGEGTGEATGEATGTATARQHWFSTMENDQSLQLFKERVLYKYEMTSGEEENVAEGGSILIHNVTCLTNDVVAVVYKVLPKNAVHYRIPSATLANLLFVKLDSAIGLPKNIQHTTSIAKIVKEYLSNYLAFPVVVDDISVAHVDRVRAFAEDIDEYVEEVLKNCSIPDPSLVQNNINLQQSLSTLFIKNSNRVIETLQYQQTLTRLLLSALHKHNNESNPDVGPLFQKVKQKKQEIENRLRQCLINIVLESFVKAGISVSTVDNYILLSMSKVSERATNIEVLLQLPEQIVLKVEGSSIAETFEIPRFGLEPFRDKMVYSTTNHGWATCDLTYLPILTMNNQVDELQQFRYIHPNDVSGELAVTLLNELDYCYISGNRKYDIR